jgi:hypothetical protein
MRSYTEVQNARERSGVVVHIEPSRAASENRAYTWADASRTSSTDRSWPAPASTVTKRSANVGSTWTSVSPTSKKTARNRTTRG